MPRKNPPCRGDLRRGTSPHCVGSCAIGSSSVKARKPGTGLTNRCCAYGFHGGEPVIVCVHSLSARVRETRFGDFRRNRSHLMTFASGSATTGWPALIVLVFAVVLSGCGGGDAPAPSAGTLPAASITGGSKGNETGSTNPASGATDKAAARFAELDDAADENEDEMAADASKAGPLEPVAADDLEVENPAPGSVQAVLKEMTGLRMAPPPKTEDVGQLKAERKVRNQKIVALAQDVITRTHDAADQERLFDAAVHGLLEARLQLVLAGETSELEALYGDAGALYKRNPQSRAAAAGALALVNLAYSQAKQSTPPDPHWLKEFARQARHYAVTFPKEEAKSVPLLFTSARSCELNGLVAEAQEAYSTLQQSFPRSPFAAKATGIARRLSLPGNLVQLSGPKLDGEMFSTEDLLGRIVIVVFWSTDTQAFVADLPELVKAQQALSSSGVTFVGVNFDTDVSKVAPFVMRHKLTGPQIVFREEKQAGWQNPIATFYGLMDIPAVWIIDRQGTAVTTTAKLSTLAAEVGELLKKDPVVEEKTAEGKGTGGN